MATVIVAIVLVVVLVAIVLVVIMNKESVMVKPAMTSLFMALLPPLPPPAFIAVGVLIVVNDD